MDVRRRRRPSSTRSKPPPPHSSAVAAAGELLLGSNHHYPKASDALPLPLYLTNAVFLALFFSVAYFLLRRWREKIRDSTPLHVVTLSELAALVSLLASLIYLLGFFGIGLVQSFVSRSPAPHDIGDVKDPWRVMEQEEDKFIIKEEECEGEGEGDSGACAQCTAEPPLADAPSTFVALTEEDEEVIKSVVAGTTPSYTLESKLRDCKKAAAIRREAVQRTTGRSMEGLAFEGFDYTSILGQCCEMPIGYVQVPVGVAGPLLLDGIEYVVPMATTEGCLVASTNRGCKAINTSGGATSVVLRDGMTRAPVVRFGSAKRAAELKLFLEDAGNFEAISVVFSRLVLICVYYEGIHVVFWKFTYHLKKEITTATTLFFRFFPCSSIFCGDFSS